jgi:hypothetical protein
VAKSAKPKRKAKPAKTAALKRAILTVVHGTNPRVWTVEDLMAATQCTDQELLSRCCDELIDDGHLRPKLLPLPLTPEEVAQIKAEKERQRRWGRELDRAQAIRDGLIPPPKLARVTERQEEPASQSQPQQAQPQSSPATPERQSQPRVKPKAKVGAERDYDRDAIRWVAKELPESGTDKHRSWFYQRVRDECSNKRPVVKTPANDRTMGRIISDLYFGPKVSSSQD